MVSILVAPVVQANGPEYTYIGISYEWTDVKYGLNPKVDDAFNNGSLEGENIDFSLGLLSWLHINGQAFGFADGKCVNCNTELDGSSSDADVEAIKVGIGVNFSLDKIGLSENADFVIRGNYVDTELSNLNRTSPSTISDNGWSAEGLIRGQISDRADVHVGFEFYDLGSVKNRDVTIGLNYRVWEGISVLARGIIFDSETGFELGLRWQFGNLLFNDRDSIF
ncbi:MAG: hypothetical protein CL797_09370 [Chromatiales bacterium]|nr:hypothetical protein [Chromatiales bacterium]